MAVAGFWCGVIAGLAVIVVNRKFMFIGPKLVNCSLGVRLAVEGVFRAFLLVIIIYVLPSWFYTCVDLCNAVRFAPIRLEAKVLEVHESGLTWFMTKGLVIEADDGSHVHYSLDLYPTRPNRGERYKMVILPRSKKVLSLQPVELKQFEHGAKLNL